MLFFVYSFYRHLFSIDTTRTGVFRRHLMNTLLYNYAYTTKFSTLKIFLSVINAKSNRQIIFSGNSWSGVSTTRQPIFSTCKHITWYRNSL